ncbi:MAG: chorismate synthase [Firmicutes bacterium]|nr:chorismate synthase [Bacillota bacterium]
MTVPFGENLQIEVYGTSHGPCIGVRMEGFPEGIVIDPEQLQTFLDRRAPGRNAWSTPRKEADRPVFLSGVEDAGSGSEAEQEAGQAQPLHLLRTNGEALVAEIRNTNTRPQDYEASSVVPRPAHADYPAWIKYGKIESGGGQFSARLTAALCIAGGIALQWLKRRGVRVAAHIASIGDIQDTPFDPLGLPEQAGREPLIQPDFPVIDPARGEAMKALIAEVKSEGDSIGGSIECMIYGVPAGAGEPLFGSIEARICQSLFAVPAVKGIEFGAGFSVTAMKGSENNDPYQMEGGAVVTGTNHHGGILGGLASGMPIVFRTAMKPTPSIALPQRSVDLVSMTETELQIKGRHDPCIVPRAVPCIEAAAAIAIMDVLLG